MVNTKNNTYMEIDRGELNDVLQYSVEAPHGDIDDFIFMGQDSFVSDR